MAKEQPKFKLGKHEVLCQKWEESEAGWGTSPDGISLHLSHFFVENFIQEYWEGMPDNVPSVYSRPDGEPYALGVSRKTFEAMMATRNGIRYYEVQSPGTGGVGGWQRLE